MLSNLIIRMSQKWRPKPLAAIAFAFYFGRGEGAAYFKFYSSVYLHPILLILILFSYCLPSHHFTSFLFLILTAPHTLR